MPFKTRLGRRDFLQTGIGLAMAAAASGCRGQKEELQASKIVPGKVPEYVPGKLPMKWADEAMIRKAAEVHPFDLQTRMDIAVNARTTCVDPNLGYICYSQVFFQTQPPEMVHLVGDFVDDMGRHTDSLWLNRGATNDRSNDEVVRKIAQNAMDVVDHGIGWDPPENPWLWWGTTSKDRPQNRWAHLPENTRIILGMVTYYRATGDPRALDTAKSMVQAFYEIAEKNDKYLWYPDFNYEQVGTKIRPMAEVTGSLPQNMVTKEAKGRVDFKQPESGTGVMGGDQPAAMMGLMLLPVIRYYQETKDPVAAELATKFSRLVVDLMPDFGKNIGHVHSALATASGVFMTGQVLGNTAFKDWAEEVYRKFTSFDFIPDFGWTPENTGRPRVKGRLCCETCSTVDYIELASELAQYRNERYWDDVERISMNQLLEGQMLSTGFVDRIPLPLRKPLSPMDPKWLSTDHTMDRSLGCFGIISGPNDWIQTGEQIMSVQCCFGSGPRGLYDAWYYAAQEEGDTVQVNLQFSKRLPSAVITSYMPGKARLEIEMAAGKKLRVRKPGWARAERMKVVVDGKEKKVPLVGTYFDLGYLVGGTKVRMEFPAETVRKTERIGEVEFRTVWRGNAVVEMEPKGEIYPLYQGRDRQDGVTPLPFLNPQAIDPL